DRVVTSGLFGTGLGHHVGPGQDPGPDDVNFLKAASDTDEHLEPAGRLEEVEPGLNDLQPCQETVDVMGQVTDRSGPTHVGMTATGADGRTSNQRRNVLKLELLCRRRRGTSQGA